MAGPIRDPKDAFQQLEAVMLRQMLQSSGAFRSGSTPGSQLRTDMFIETLADAVAKAGGLGIGRMLERQLGAGGAGKATGETSSSPGRSENLRGAAASTSTALRRLESTPLEPRRGVGGLAPSPAWDLVDDPNSDAPLPEDPSALSLDDFQPGAPGARGAGDAARRPEVSGEITSRYGQRVHPLTGERHFHTGVDLRANEGAAVRAVRAGVVREAGMRGGYGNVVEIDHGDGTTTLYAHASQLLVEKGQRVAEGEEVARVGHTGQATGPHLHFELRRHDRPVDPSGVIQRALNRYRQRAEDPIAGGPSVQSGDDR